jgi:hypothetical protein
VADRLGPAVSAVSMSREEYRSRYGHRDELLAELSTALGVPPIRKVGVTVPRGRTAGWTVDVGDRTYRLTRAQLADGQALDAWRREVANDPNLPALIDERGLIKSILHRLSGH